MGLDMWAYSAKKEQSESEEQTKLQYWRKHPNLHGWMESLYRENGGEDLFNCIELELTMGDLIRLERDILDKNLPKTEGFFFGDDSDTYYEEQDLSFIEEAKEAIKSGLRVFYYSWW